MSSAESADSGSCVRVLVVDDEANITELVPLGLRYEGFEVMSASDGRGALEHQPHQHHPHGQRLRTRSHPAGRYPRT